MELQSNKRIKFISELARAARDLTNKEVNGDIDLTPNEMSLLDSYLLDIINITDYPDSVYSKNLMKD
jgi:hypothetical protein